MLAGCYTLDLYCDLDDPDHPEYFDHGYGAFPVQIFDEFGSRCRAIARERGWTIRPELTLCPRCTKKRRSTT